MPQGQSLKVIVPRLRTMDKILKTVTVIRPKERELSKNFHKELEKNGLIFCDDSLSVYRPFDIQNMAVQIEINEKCGVKAVRNTYFWG